MEEIMQSNSYFIIPLTLAYLSICGIWFILDKSKLGWQINNIARPEKPWLEMGIALFACLAILAIGQLYSSGYLIPGSTNSTLSQLSWVINNFIIYSPIFIVLLVRKQKPETVFISKKELLKKVAFGFVTSLIGMTLFVGTRGEWNRLLDIAFTAIQPKALSNLPATFFENVALAFLFVRLKWAVGVKWAILIPAVLFALAHVPGSLAEGDPWSHILTFFILTGGLTTVILYTVYRSRDIIWLGVVHFVMDIAIKAF